MSEQMTVDQLLEKLSNLSQSGYGDMPIVLGEKYPLLDDAIGIHFYEHKLQIRNTYYDKKIAEALRKASENMELAYRTYLEDCHKAGMEMEE